MFTLLKYIAISTFLLTTISASVHARVPQKRTSSCEPTHVKPTAYKKAVSGVVWGRTNLYGSFNGPDGTRVGKGGRSFIFPETGWPGDNTTVWSNGGMCEVNRFLQVRAVVKDKDSRDIVCGDWTNPSPNAKARWSKAIVYVPNPNGGKRIPRETKCYMPIEWLSYP